MKKFFGPILVPSFLLAYSDYDPPCLIDSPENNDVIVDDSFDGYLCALASENIFTALIFSWFYRS